MFLVVLMVFGPKKLPELGSSLGESIRVFGRGLKGEDDEQGALEPADAPATKNQ